MDGPDFLGALPGIVLVLLGLCALVLLVMAAVTLFGFFFKVGVVVHESRRPPHLDSGDYRLDQGREVRPEQDARVTKEER